MSVEIWVGAVFEGISIKTMFTYPTKVPKLTVLRAESRRGAGARSVDTKLGRSVELLIPDGAGEFQILRPCRQRRRGKSRDRNHIQNSHFFEEFK